MAVVMYYLGTDMATTLTSAHNCMHIMTNDLGGTSFGYP